MLVTLVRIPNSFVVKDSSLRLEIFTVELELYDITIIPFDVMMGLRNQSSTLHLASVRFSEDEKSTNASRSIVASLHGNISTAMGDINGNSMSLVWEINSRIDMK